MTETITDYGRVSFEEVASTVWIVRGHDEGYGSKYNWMFVLVKDGDIGLAKGLIANDPDEINDNMPGTTLLLCSEDIKAIRDFVDRHGMKCVRYVRIRHSGKTIHNIKC